MSNNNTFVVSAGFPSPARDYSEKLIDLNELLTPNSASTYFLRVDGYSMINANIQHNDILVVDRSIEPQNNMIIIAVIDGEITVKRLKIKDNGYWLYPENEKFKPVKIEEWMDFMIWGVVVWVLHKL